MSRVKMDPPGGVVPVADAAADTVADTHADADTLAEPDSCVTGAKDADGARDWRVARPVVIEL